MFEFLAFCCLFEIFMFRAYMFDWKSMFSPDSFPDEDIHIISFFIFTAVSFGILLAAMIKVADVKTRLDTEYKGVYAPPAEFLSGVKPAAAGKAGFSENAGCETDAD